MFEVVLDGTDAIGASAATAFPGGDAFEECTALLRRQLAGGRHDDPQSERRSARTCRAVVAAQGINEIVAHLRVEPQRCELVAAARKVKCDRCRPPGRYEAGRSTNGAAGFLLVWSPRRFLAEQDERTEAAARPRISSRRRQGRRRSRQVHAD
jgi:hypothetical protein